MAKLPYKSFVTFIIDEKSMPTFSKSALVVAQFKNTTTKSDSTLYKMEIFIYFKEK